MASINYKVSYTLQVKDQFLCNISLRFIVHCFFVIDWIIVQEVFNKKSFVILSRKKIRNISLRFIVHIIYYGLQYNTSSKRVNKALLYCLGGRPVSLQKFGLIHIVYLFLHGCGLHYNVLSGLSVKQVT